MAGPINAVLQAYLNTLKQPTSENNVPYMYVDTVGKMTVGVGHNLTAHKDHKSLPFKVQRFERHPVRGGDTGVAITSNKTAGRAATADEIQNDYDFLNKHRGLGKYTVASGKLQKYTTVELDQKDIDEVFAKDLNAAIEGVKKVFGKAFDTYPLSCQAGLIDIQFNTGNVKGFPKLIEAVTGQGAYAGKPESERWAAAAIESNRPQVSPERNMQVAQWFNKGAAERKAP